ncbi:MAG: Pls/PosA family non-ribosomal peptide synthetase, partial [Pseudonocardiaceae bacterium]
MTTEPEVREVADPTVPGYPAAVLDRVLVCAGYEHTVRWRPGERLDHLFEERCDGAQYDGSGHHGSGSRLAVDTGDLRLTYQELDARANQLARHLISRGARPGDRIGLLFDQAVHSYLGMLAVLKINAAYVPLDAGFPADRLRYITRDAGVRMVLSLAHLRECCPPVPGCLICVDEITARVAAEDPGRLSAAEKGEPVDQLCYVIYTSGSTGRPKGVPIDHAGICNFVRVAAEVYGIRPADRVYQGMTIAFDFSVEEIWVPLAAGATLVPKPGGAGLLGRELWEFLQANAVTALCCVPTLLATLDEDLPLLRFLLVSGEACPQDLVTRWYRPDRRFLNVYGPTEATVTATWSSVHPTRPVTIGVPLPTYSVVILDPSGRRALHRGAVGEIGLAGIGLTSGYLNRADLTDRVFVPDFLGLGNNPSGRIYRTGDAGRVNDDGEIEYLGRIDTQVKIRGYRVELTEIESVLRQLPGIAQAVVNPYQPEPGTVELVAYYTRRADNERIDQQQVFGRLRQLLPRYMVPAYLEELPAIPTLPSNKADRNRLPPPTSGRSLAGRDHYVGPVNDTERQLAEALAASLRLERVSVDSHFFDELGADSLLMAQFCARLRRCSDLAPVAMKDVYLHPTISSLAAAQPEPVSGPDRPGTPPPEQPAPITTARYLLCAAMQLLVFLGISGLGGVLLKSGYEWSWTEGGLLDRYARSLLFGTAGFVVLCAVPVLAKWLLVGRWACTEFPVWSLAYVRFWTVKLLIRFNPLMLFVGSPLYVLYLRALGAKLGRGVAVFSRHLPVCTDQLTVGDNSVIRKDSLFNCYRAHGGRIQIGPVTLGENVVVGEEAILDIRTSMGDGAQLGHASSLPATQAVPGGESWHGSPAQRSTVDYRSVGPARCSAARKVGYSAVQLLLLLGLVVPTGIVALGLLVEILDLAGITLTSWLSVGTLLVISLALFLGSVLTGLAVVVTIPRVLNLLITPGKVYPLYGFHYFVHGMISLLTNSAFHLRLFGDSSYIVHYLRCLGFDLSRIEQTGSNFGNQLKHDTPYLSSVGTGSMISDGVSIINAHFSSTSFCVSPVALGARSFFGNNIAYHSNGRTGDNCLLATKVMVPIDGQIREGVGLLGSPCFEIPRSAQRDSRFEHLATGAERCRRLRAKNKYNLATIGLYLVVQWIRFFGLFLLIMAAVTLYGRFGFSVVPVTAILILPLNISYAVLVERAVARFRPLSPQFCSIYEPYYWWHERLWKLEAAVPFSGTPFKNLIWWLLGVRIGRRVFDDGCYIPEKTLVTIGDGCLLNMSSVIQCHSQEEGIFKSDRTTIGAGCTVGVNAFIHYGVT